MPWTDGENVMVDVAMWRNLFDEWGEFMRGGGMNECGCFDL